jgi:branched-chain amino acid transport system permease protein
VLLWVDGFVQGILLGGLYAQYALGMALMFGVMRIVNITHGDLTVLLALIGITLAASFKIGPWAVLAMLVITGAFIGWVLQRTILNRVVGADPLPSLIATFGLSVALQNLMLQIWSADTRSLRTGGIEQASFQIGGLYVGLLPLIVLITATVLTGGLDALLRYSRFGRSIRASAADVEAAAMTGVNPKTVYAGATAIAVAILGFAAVFQSLRATVAPADGPYQLIYAFEAVIIGGMGSIWGAFIGAMVLGVTQSIVFRIDPGFGVLAGHIVFLMVLALRPQGLLGKELRA